MLAKSHDVALVKAVHECGCEIMTIFNRSYLGNYWDLSVATYRVGRYTSLNHIVHFVGLKTLPFNFDSLIAVALIVRFLLHSETPLRHCSALPASEDLLHKNGRVQRHQNGYTISTDSYLLARKTWLSSGI